MTSPAPVTVFGVLMIAAVLEVLGDAAMRAGFVRSPWWFAAGAASLCAYGVLVNASRSIDFGRLLGAYVAVFFLASQLVAVVVFRERMSAMRLVGGALIVVGGVVVLWGER